MCLCVCLFACVYCVCVCVHCACERAPKVLSTAKAHGGKVVLVSISGGVVALDTLAPSADAVIDAFNPASTGPNALATLLFGDANRWGKLPVRACVRACAARSFGRSAAGRFSNIPQPTLLVFRVLLLTRGVPS